MIHGVFKKAVHSLKLISVRLTDGGKFGATDLHSIDMAKFKQLINNSFCCDPLTFFISTHVHGQYRKKQWLTKSAQSEISQKLLDGFP